MHFARRGSAASLDRALFCRKVTAFATRRRWRLWNSAKDPRSGSHSLAPRAFAWRQMIGMKGIPQPESDSAVAMSIERVRRRRMSDLARRLGQIWIMLDE
jgi:hypothetical protein